jgi:uncharacterized membrane protein YagU involved in acid resistance
MSTTVRQRRHTPAHLAQQAAIGAAAGLIGGFMMNLFAEAVHAKPAHGVQGAQKKRRDEDPAEKAGALVYRAVVGHKPRRKAVKRRLGTAMHYAFGAAAGAAYTLSAEFVPAMRFAFGLAYGALVWAVADEVVTPALGLSKLPQENPPEVHLFALGGHAVFAATVEAVSRTAELIA